VLSAIDGVAGDAVAMSGLSTLDTARPSSTLVFFGVMRTSGVYWAKTTHHACMHAPTSSSKEA
jgi:hypothetical protein